MKGLKRLAVSAMAGMAALAMTGCGGSGSASEDHTYSVWLYNGQDASYYTDYAENPTIQYLMSKTWGENEDTIKLEFQVPPAGRQQENYETMVATGDFPTLMQGSVADAPPRMLESEMIVDITDLVKEYMPNYYNRIQTNETLKSKAVFNIDGEEKILSINVANEDYGYYFSGNMYRRDWIVKYGKNPQTGAAFTGGYTDEADVDSWVDDVVFPSGGTEPVYISDWEWMFEIFTEAMADLNITDSYCTSIYYPGYMWSGGLCSCFGEPIPIWYKGSDDVVRFGGDSESMRAYLQCLNNWYEKGWLDQDFNERTADIFYATDDTNKRLGKVGMWIGTQAELGGRLDMHDGGLTEGIYVAGCAWPINDVYGDDSCKNVEPWATQAGTSLVGTGFLVMEGAQEKDLGPLLSMLDYLYSDEGAVVRTLGATPAQMEEAGLDTSFYTNNGIENGTYTMGEDGRYKKVDAITNDSGGLLIATTAQLLPGYQLVSSVDEGYAENYENSMKSWIRYPNKGQVWGSDAFALMSSEDMRTIGDLQTKVLNYMEQHTYEFIKGITDIDSDEDWSNWCTMLQKYNYQKGIDILQPYIDMNPFIG
ncbi:MAG: hypothetical protein HFH94_16040 [Lachnospiraceae bacterium]|nr:hypothetical protein [uncultured Acetatifactor sp.]MCI9221205.1 hypothetical protein [Lachnospiraceae bacterium]